MKPRINKTDLKPSGRRHKSVDALLKAEMPKFYPKFKKFQREDMARTFEKAAQIIEESGYSFCCNAIAQVYNLITADGADWGFARDLLAENRYLTAVLKPESALTAWYNSEPNVVSWDSNGRLEYMTTCRVIGLCLCAELVKEGFVPEGFEL